MYICFACRPNNDRLARAAGAFSASTILALLSFYKFHSFILSLVSFYMLNKALKNLQAPVKKRNNL